jgi:membrane-bound lytic murein transglycosylase D
MTLVLPRDKAIAFLKAENQLLATRKSVKDTLPEHQQGMTSIQYVVQNGDYLHKIAIRYGCTIDDLCRWNKLNDRNISAGMKLVIWTKSH